MGSSVLLHYLRNICASEARCRVQARYLVFSALEGFRIGLFRGGQSHPTRVSVEEP